MKKIKAILLMAGASTRFHSNRNKTIYQINQKPLYLYSLDLFYQHPKIAALKQPLTHFDQVFSPYLLFV